MHMGSMLPLRTQYLHYWRGIVHGNLGQSLRLHDSVLHLILQRYPYTLALTAAAMLLGVGLAIPAGVYSATRRDKWQDRASALGACFGL